MPKQDMTPEQIQAYIDRLEAENAQIPVLIAEIHTLKSEIQALKARLNDSQQHRADLLNPGLITR